MATRWRPLARRRLRTAWPFLVAMRARKPWVRLRLVLLGLRRPFFISFLSTLYWHTGGTRQNPLRAWPQVMCGRRTVATRGVRWGDLAASAYGLTRPTHTACTCKLVVLTGTCRSPATESAPLDDRNRSMGPRSIHEFLVSGSPSGLGGGPKRPWIPPDRQCGGPMGRLLCNPAVPASACGPAHDVVVAKVGDRHGLWPCP